MDDSKRDLLRHILATVSYRGGKAIKDAPEHFADFKIGETTKTPLEILSHIGDLFAWALSQAEGREIWGDSATLSWEDETARFFETIRIFDDFLVSDKMIEAPIERLFQGPLADALTHVGQIAMLRRLANSPIRGENYFKAEIQSGLIGFDHISSVSEFD